MTLTDQLNEQASKAENERILQELDRLDLLNRYRGCKVTLLLTNGTNLVGKIAETNVDYSDPSARMVHLTALEGQEYFDALIPKETIVGFIFRRPGT